MTKKPYSAKHGKDLPDNKHIQELAEDDYVDPAGRDNFSDSDLLANQVVTVKSSDNETREDGASKSLAQYENEEQERRMKELEEKPTDWLYSRAREAGIPDWSHLQRSDL